MRCNRRSSSHVAAVQLLWLVTPASFFRFGGIRCTSGNYLLVLDISYTLSLALASCSRTKWESEVTLVKGSKFKVLHANITKLLGIETVEIVSVKLLQW